MPGTVPVPPPEPANRSRQALPGPVDSGNCQFAAITLSARSWAILTRHVRAFALPLTGVRDDGPVQTECSEHTPVTGSHVRYFVILAARCPQGGEFLARTPAAAPAAVSVAPCPLVFPPARGGGADGREPLRIPPPAEPARPAGEPVRAARPKARKPADVNRSVWCDSCWSGGARCPVRWRRRGDPSQMRVWSARRPHSPWRSSARWMFVPLGSRRARSFRARRREIRRVRLF